MSSSYHRPKDVVCVTGASGYVATELVKTLLEDGYKVHGTVRSLTNKEKIGHLENFDKAFPGGSLQLFEADMTQLTTLESALVGCTTLFHTAAPFTFDASKAKEMMKTTVDSVDKIFKLASKFGIERVVLTSSTGAISSFLPTDKPNKILTEDDWNTDIDEEIWIGNGVLAYMASKSLEERAAMAAAKKYNVKLSCINPNLVCGPVYYGRQPTSISSMKVALEGNSEHPFTFPWVDVRDVAKAHVECMRQDVDGRFIVSNRKMLTPAYVAQVLRNAFPDFEFQPPPPSDDGEEDAAKGCYERFDNTKVVDKLLKRPLRSAEETIVTMARTMYAGGFATPKLKAQKVDEKKDD